MNVNPVTSLVTNAERLTIARTLGYKPNTMFTTDRVHHWHWHHHHPGGGLAIVFAALTEAS